MREGYSFEQPVATEELLDQKLEALSEREQERLQKSWVEVEKFATSMEKWSVEGADASKFEHRDEEETKQSAQEISNFFEGFFGAEENTDASQTEIGIRREIVENYIARDPEGKIASILQSQIIEVPSTEVEGKSELMFMIWYLATNKEYTGKPVTPNLFALAMKDLLKKSRDELKPIKAFIGETASEVEGMFNFFGLNRIYYNNKKGETSEVPYECIPEDGSTKGVPSHLMVRLFDDRQTMPASELIEMVDGVYAQYTRAEYFLDVDDKLPKDLTKPVDKEHRKYKETAGHIREKFVEELNKVEGDLFFKSRNERKEEKVAKKK